MSRWLVSSLPSWALLIGLIVLIAGAAMLIQGYVRHRFPALNGEDHNDVTRFTYGFIGFIYAFFIGFMVSSLWGQTNQTYSNALAEGAAGVQMTHDSVVFDTADRDRIRQSLLAYEQAAVAEWSTVSMDRSPEADAALSGVYTAYGQVQARTGAQTTLLATSYSNLDKLSQARTVRLVTARESAGVPWPLWAVVFIASAMVLGTAVVYGVDRPAMHYPMVAIVAVIVATNLFLILELSHPYVGAVATTSDPLQEVEWALSQPVG